MSLSDQHRQLLKETSGLTDYLIDTRGYRTIPRDEFHAMTGAEGMPFSPYLLKATGWMGIPVIRPDGKKHCEIVRVDGSTDTLNGFQRYVWPKNGVRNALDIHPQATKYVSDPEVPLVVTEGIKKADAILRFSSDRTPYCVLGQNGCWGWRSNPKGASVACPDWLDIGMEDREVFVVVDSDYLTNDNVKAGWDQCIFYLTSKVNHENRVRLVVVPPKGRVKQGADDYLLNHTLDDLLSLAVSPKQAPSVVSSELEVLGSMDLVEASDDDVKWVIRRAVAEESITVLAGHTQTFKTWHAMEMGIAGALTKSWLDHPELVVEDTAPCLYFNKEMRGKFGTRLKALIHDESYALKYPDIRILMSLGFYIVEQANFDLKMESSVLATIEAAKMYGAKIIIFDSLSMSWTGEENSNSEVGNLFHTLRRIIEETGSSIVLLHHLVKPSKDRAGFNPIHHMRGAGQLAQQADAVFLFMVDKQDDEGATIKVVNAKSRDERELPSFLTRFAYNEGYHRSLTYQGETAAILAQESKANPTQVQLFENFLMQTIMDYTNIRNKMIPGGDIKAVVEAYWDSAWGDKPGDKKMQRGLNALKERGLLVQEGNQRRGYEYGLPLEDEEESPPILKPEGQEEKEA